MLLFNRDFEGVTDYDDAYYAIVADKEDRLKLAKDTGSLTYTNGVYVVDGDSFVYDKELTCFLNMQVEIERYNSVSSEAEE